MLLVEHIHLRPISLRSPGNALGTALWKKHCAGYQLEMGMLKKCCAQTRSSKQVLCIVCKARIQFIPVVCTRLYENIIR